jgi:AcrR family transcriptional regulator
VAEPLIVEVPADHVGPVHVILKRGTELMAELTTHIPASPEPEIEPVSAREALPQERRERIYSAACDVISQKGLAATSMRDIANAAGMSVGTMYRYIDNKDDLLYHITADCMEELFAYFEAELTEAGSAPSRMDQAIRAYLSYISVNHRYINLVYRETKALADEPRARIYDIERRFIHHWARIIHDGIGAGDFADVDVDLAANIAYFSCTVWALRYWSIGDRSEREVGDLLTKFILNGLAAGSARGSTIKD